MSSVRMTMRLGGRVEVAADAVMHAVKNRHAAIAACRRGALTPREARRVRSKQRGGGTPPTAESEEGSVGVTPLH